MRRLILLLLVAAAAPGLEPLHTAGRRLLTSSGEPVGLLGVGLLKTHSFWARTQRPEQFRGCLAALPAAGVNAVRVPLNAALLQPAPGVFADHPDYVATLRRHHLGTGYLACVEALLTEAERLGLYVVIELRELPCDPYRWFTGGDEDRRGSGLEGGGLDWMAAPTALAEGLPPLHGWLAQRWRGRAGIAAIEVPFTPSGAEPALDPAAHRELAGRCAAAVKQADPERLVLLAPSGDGSGTSPAETLFDGPLPDGIDALAPRLHLGAHAAAATAEDAYSTVPLTWLSWFSGFGVPVVVGSYGPATNTAGWPPSFDESPAAGRRVLEASLAAFCQGGAAGAFVGDWDAPPAGEPAFSGDRAVVARYAARLARPAAEPAHVAVLVAPRRRSADGLRDDLLSLARGLIELGVTSFDTLFPEQATPQRLGEYRAVLAWPRDLPSDTLASLAAAGPQHLVLDPDRWRLEGLRRFLEGAGIACEAVLFPVWRFDTGREVTLYNWSDAPASVGVTAAAGQQLGDLDTGSMEEPLDGIVRVFVPAFRSRYLRRVEPDELFAPQVSSVATAQRLPLLVRLYDRGPVRGRWLEPWAGAGAHLRKAEDGREVIAIETDGPDEQVTVRFDPGQPVSLRGWHRAAGARLELLLRLTSSPPAAMALQLVGVESHSDATCGLLPSREWQRVTVPLDTARPGGVPETLTGFAIRLVPSGSAEIGSVWLMRDADE